MQWICWRVILCCFKHTLIYLNGINKNYLYQRVLLGLECQFQHLFFP
jgi:hypothetical protein